MLFLFIIRRLSPRGRVIVAAAVTLAGLVLLGVAATVASWLLIHGILTTALGLAFGVAAYVEHKKAHRRHEVPAQSPGVSPVHG
jgi:hypothetical protein